MGRNQRDEPINIWTTINGQVDSTLDANVNDTLITSDVLATLIDELDIAGVIQK